MDKNCSISLVSVTFDQSDFDEDDSRRLFNIEIYRALRFQPEYGIRSAQININSNEMADKQLEKSRNQYLEKISSILATLYKKNSQHPLFIDINVIKNMDCEVLLDGKDLCKSKIYEPICKNLEVSGVKFRWGKSSNGDYLIKNIHRLDFKPNCLQINIRADLLDDPISEEGILGRGQRIFEESVIYSMLNTKKK